MIETRHIATPQQQRARLEAVRVIMRYLFYKQQFLKYPTVPADEIKSLAKTKAIKDTTANTLTAAVVLLIELLGGFATRQQSQGQYNARLRRFTKSTTKKGVSDVTGVLSGKPLNIEIKIGKDRQSPEQKQVQKDIEAAGGYYFIAKNLPDTYDYITTTCGISETYLQELLREGKQLLGK